MPSHTDEITRAWYISRMGIRTGLVHPVAWQRRTGLVHPVAEGNVMTRHTGLVHPAGMMKVMRERVDERGTLISMHVHKQVLYSRFEGNEPSQEGGTSTMCPHVGALGGGSKTAPLQQAKWNPTRR